MKNFIFFNQTLSPSIFVFVPCRQPVDPWFSSVDFLWTVFHRFFWCLFVHVPWLISFTSTPLCSLFFTAFLSFSDFFNHLLLSQSIFRRATLVIDVPMHCQLHSLFLILALAYGSHFHFVWWCFDHWNFTFPSLTFVTFLLVPLYGLATLVFSVPMCCQPDCLFLNLVLYHGSLFQPVLCETMQRNLPVKLFKFGQPAFHINVFVDALYQSRWTTSSCSLSLTLCHIHLYTYFQLSTHFYPLMCRARVPDRVFMDGFRPFFLLHLG